VNAFTPGGGYVYIHRGLMNYLNSEGELASVLGHEIDMTLRDIPRGRQTRDVLMSVGAVAAAIASDQRPSRNGEYRRNAWMQGYGRDNEMEADRLGSNTPPGRAIARSHGGSLQSPQRPESFELQRAKEEEREPNIYHGVFSDHPAPDARAVQAAQSAATSPGATGGWIDNREAYLSAINGLPYGSSREQGIVRDNRFYHEGMGLTVAFPRGWTVHNLRDRLLVYTKRKMRSCRSPPRSARKSSRHATICSRN